MLPIDNWKCGNVANVKMLPVANTNVANWELELELATFSHWQHFHIGNTKQSLNIQIHMMAGKSIFLVLVATLLARAYGSVEATLTPEGTVCFGGDALAEIAPVAYLDGWRTTQVKSDYSCVGRTSLCVGDWAVADVAATLSPVGGGKVRLEVEFAMREDVTLETLCCLMSFKTNDVARSIWRADGREGAFARPANDGIAIANGSGKDFAFPFLKTGEMLRIEAEECVGFLVQHNWKWGDTCTVRLGITRRRNYVKGEKARLAFLLSSGDGLDVKPWTPYRISEGKDWAKMDYRRDIVPESALDFSRFGLTDAPAGKYGWLKNVNGHFEFERQPGKVQRFYGVNLCFDANYPDHKLADILVKRFKRLGYNSIRIHHHDSRSVEGSEDGVTLNEKNMDLLDYLVAAAIREGLYVTTDLYVSRAAKIKWRHIGVDRDGVVGDIQLFKALCAVHEPALHNWVAYAENFLLHTNKYTGRRYIDEPAMPLISLVNEGGLFMGWDRCVRDDERVVASWKSWLEKRRSADPAFAPGLELDRLPRNYWDAKTRPFVEEWAGELEAAMVAKMKSHIRQIGCKALITNDNCGPHYIARHGMAGDCDYIDDHFYVDHPAFLDKRWRLPSRCPNVNPLLATTKTMPLEYDWPRVDGKPFTITEWNFAAPGRYRAIGGILTGACASLKAWDGLWRFAYAHSSDNLRDDDERRLGYFDLASDPLAQASDMASICLFLRGDMAEAGSGALKIDRERGSFALVTPRTCGGFAESGTVDAVAVRFSSESPATVWASSLDMKPLEESSRILVTHLTDTQGDGAKFADARMQILLDWGGKPLIAIGEAAIELRMKALGEGDVKVYQLDTAGRRIDEVPYKFYPDAQGGGELRFVARTSEGGGGRIFYEIER